jgi:hypothetical protein
MNKIVLIILLFTSGFLKSQEKEIQKVEIEFTLKDNSHVRGYIIGQTDTYFIVRTHNHGDIKIYNDEIIEKRVYRSSDSLVYKSTGYQNQFGYKYFISNSAIPIEPKRWYYTNTYGLFSNFSYGISKRVSVGATFFSIPSSLISPKIRVTLNPEGKVKVAFTGQYLFISTTSTTTTTTGSTTSSKSYRESYHYGFAQVLVTFGSSQKGTTIGVGKFISQGGIFGGYIGTLAIVRKLSPKTSFISDNNLVFGGTDLASESIGLVSLGVRLDRRKHSFDFGLMMPAAFTRDRSIVIPFPYAGYNLKIGKP